MHKAVKILLLCVVFALSFFIWPGFGVNYEYDCDGVSASFLASGGECPVGTSAKLGDVRLGGGWRWFTERNCIVGGEVQLASRGICPASRSKERAEVVPFMLVGSLIITSVVGTVLFKPWKTISKHKS